MTSPLPMKRPTLTAVLCALALAARASGAAPPLLSPRTVLPDPAAEPAWRTLFAELAPKGSRESSFVERRYFPFRRQPVVLTGEIRIAPGLGLSLDYLTPEPRILIADRRGLLMRDGRGHERAVPGGFRARESVSALIDILRFDVPALRRDFVIHGLRADGNWTLAFVPRDPALAGGLSAVTVSGAGAVPAEIDLVRSADRRVVIDLRGARENVVFTPAERARYFR
jgi:hypothetical protein